MSKLVHQKLNVVLAVVIVLSCQGNPGSRALERDSSEISVAFADDSEPHSTRLETNSANGSRDSGNDLVASRILGGPDTFGTVSEITPVGNYIVVTDRGGPPHVNVFDRASGQLVRRFGGTGRGPREFLGVNWLFRESHDPPRVWLFDYMLRRGSLLDLDATDSLIIADQFRIEVAAQIRYPAILGDTIVAGGFYPDMVFLIMDRDQNVLSRVIGDLPYTVNDVEGDFALGMLNKNWTAFDPSRSRVVVAYQRVNRIDFFRINGTQFVSGTSPRTIPAPTYRFAPDGTFVFEEMSPVYWNVTASDNYVYALFNGAPMDFDLPQKMAYRVDVFTWDGEYVTEFVLDHDITAFSVTEDDSLLYGAALEPFPAVVEWNLPAWLRERVSGSRE
jgi:TolB-like protein